MISYAILCYPIIYDTYSILNYIIVKSSKFRGTCTPAAAMARFFAPRDITY